MRGPECNGRAGKFSAGGVCEKFSEPLGAGSAADAGGCAEVTAGQNRKARRENKNSFHRTERSGVRFGGRPQGGRHRRQAEYTDIDARRVDHLRSRGREATVRERPNPTTLVAAVAPTPSGLGHGRPLKGIHSLWLSQKRAKHAGATQREHTRCRGSSSRSVLRWRVASGEGRFCLVWVLSRRRALEYPSRSRRCSMNAEI